MKLGPVDKFEVTFSYFCYFFFLLISGNWAYMQDLNFQRSGEANQIWRGMYSKETITMVSYRWALALFFRQSFPVSWPTIWNHSAFFEISLKIQSNFAHAGRTFHSKTQSDAVTLLRFKVWRYNIFLPYRISSKWNVSPNALGYTIESCCRLLTNSFDWH